MTAETIHLAPVVRIESCPICGIQQIVRLPADWQKRVGAGASIAIVACGNPWHYANLDG
jgi:hypothetical protein